MRKNPSKAALRCAEQYLRAIDGNDFNSSDGHAVLDLARIIDSRAKTGALLKALEASEEPLNHIAQFVNQFDRQPIGKTHDEFYGIHTGTEFEASLKLSEFRKAFAALKAIRRVKSLLKDVDEKWANVYRCP